ncbi:MAG: nuclear transport factor 2 family protein [Hyphomicrobiaceae bacterium]|nr:nuclear transport factor 2 family protein [Hyphomicrobiaceae bacterium]
MGAADTVALIERYYRAFNAGDSEAMLACVAEDIVHDVNQGARRTGKAAFRAFAAHMERCYAERVENIAVMTTGDGTRAAAEFDVLGTYIETDEGLPPAGGQTYRVPSGAFFEVEGGLIVRITAYYNLSAWLKQIAAAETKEPPA